MQSAPRSPAPQRSAPRYPDWKAPAEDGKFLVWPEPKQILADTQSNQTHLKSADQILISGIPLNKLRSQQRKWIGHGNDDQPLVATGHQTELIHPGVWVKHVLIDHAARQLGGTAFQFAVDTDAPKHLTLRWPGDAMPISDDAHFTTAAWGGLLRSPSAEYRSQLRLRFSAAADQWSFPPQLPTWFDQFDQTTAAWPNLSTALARSIHALDHSLGLRRSTVIVSPMFLSEPYLAFLHHVMSDAAIFAQVYNQALADYRAAHKTKSPSRPMPDLFVSHGSVEAPFWLDNLTDGTRSRPSVFPEGNGFVLELLSGDRFLFDPLADGEDAAVKLGQWLQQTKHRLAPRALTLTTFLRLFIADNFVHGIGGGRYDQVSDDLIAHYFHLQPPKFCVTTATMIFPQALGRQRACLPCVEQEGHRLKHRVLGNRKMEFVKEIDAYPRGSSQRQAAFSRMHRERNTALLTDPRVAAWEQRLRDTQVQEQDDDTLFDRELFYPMQSQSRLAEMIERYQTAFANSK
jgi:hypothetical protein